MKIISSYLLISWLGRSQKFLTLFHRVRDLGISSTLFSVDIKMVEICACPSLSCLVVGSSEEV